MNTLFEPRIPFEPKTLYPHQVLALKMLDQSLINGNLRPLIMAPTAFGKTLISAHIINRTLDRGKGAMFLVPNISLIGQTITAFYKEGIHDIGALQGDHPLTNPTARVQVCTIQTLARRRKPDNVGVVIVDECHNLHESLVKLMRGPRWLNTPFIGLSATPYTAGLDEIYDDLIIAATTADLIEKGFLSKFVVYAPSTFDITGVATVAGDFDKNQLAQAVDKPKLVGDVISTWKQRGENRPTLVYGVDRNHAKHLHQRFLEAGVASEYIDCHTERDDREAIFRRFRNRRNAYHLQYQHVNDRRRFASGFVHHRRASDEIRNSLRTDDRPRAPAIGWQREPHCFGPCRQCAKAWFSNGYRARYARRRQAPKGRRSREEKAQSAA